MPAVEVDGCPVVGALGWWRRRCNGGAMVHWMGLLMVLLPLLVHVFVVVDFPVNIT